jgi:hypothetical protein
MLFLLHKYKKDLNYMRGFKHTPPSFILALPKKASNPFEYLSVYPFNIFTYFASISKVLYFNALSLQDKTIHLKITINYSKF